MTRTIDCALLALPVFGAWPAGLLSASALAPVRVYRWPLAHGQHAWAQALHPQAAYDPCASQALAQAAPALQRFDVCVLPVLPDTLGWTRVALANARESLPVPVLLVARELTAAAVRDLLALGAADFILEPAGVDELKVRLTWWALHGRQHAGHEPSGTARRGPGAHHMADHAAAYGTSSTNGVETSPGRRPAPSPEAVALAVRQLSAPTPRNDSFRATRAQVLADFEREYVTSMLLRYRGNVTHAARAGNQDRRAFWQLMRKHSILSADFRHR